MGRFAQVHRDAARDGYVDTRGTQERYGMHPATLYRHLGLIGYSQHLPGLWVPDHELAYGLRVTLAMRHLGPAALLTAGSALHVREVLDDPPDDVHVLLPAGRWIAPKDGLCLHYATDHNRVRSFPAPGSDGRMVAVPRALADHARHTGFTELCRVIATAVRLRHCALPQLADEVAARARFPGRGVLRRAVEELTGELNHSGYERLGRRLLRAQIPDVPSRPLPVVHRERRIAEVDIPFFDVRYGVEIDGPHHLLPHVAAADRARDRILERDAGWTIDRFFWFELDEAPDRFVREVVNRLRRLRAD
jgi:hypothetical protein